MPGFDLHIHTTASDGILSPREAVEKAVLSGLSGIAITDHDSIDGIEEAMLWGEKLKLQVIAGMELSADYAGEDVHILGYFIHYQTGWLQEELRYLQKKRMERMKEILHKLNACGLSVTPEEVYAFSQAGAVGRPHVAQAMIQKGYVSSIKEAFDKYLGEDRIAYAERYKISVAQAVAMIHKANGQAVLAHPGLISHEEILPKVLAMGMDGLEVYHPEHTAIQQKKYRKMARRHELMITGGSDFHATRFACCTIDPAHVEALQRHSITRPVQQRF